jgi:hypothetical protein
MTEKQKPWVRVRDKATKHQYDVRRDRVNPDKHEVIERAGDSFFARPAKPNVTKRSSAAKADEGGSPDQSAAS